MGDELKPCPFCGGAAERIDFGHDEGDENAGGSAIQCGGCGAASHIEFGFKENLVSSWNDRAHPTKAAADDLIRREDAVLAVTAADKECLGANGAREFIRCIPAVPTFTAADLERAWEIGRDEAARAVHEAGRMTLGHLNAIGGLTPPADLAQRVEKGPAHD